MSEYYDRRGNRIDLFAWAALMEQDHNRHVALDRFDDNTIRVSTIWLGLNHNFGDGPPLIFETMIFGLPDDEDIECQWRYPTEIAALAGHDQAVAMVKDRLAHRA